MKGIQIPLTVASLLVVIFCCQWVTGQLEFGCAEDYCMKNQKECESIDKPGRLILNGSICGCCHIRIHPLKEGDKCNTLEMTPLPRDECGPGLMCDPVQKKCTKAKTTCNSDIDKFPLSEMTMGKPKPECDEYGDYEAVQCKTGMLCYCVDKQGKRIFGEGHSSEKENMNCKCSREYNDFLNHGLIDKDPLKFLRCNAKGGYSELQCTEKYCYCIDDKSGDLKSQALDREQGADSLPCFKDNLYKEYTTPCMKKLIDLKAQLKNQSDSGITVIGVDLPVCDPDGSFAAKQCQKDKCYCVNRFGIKFNNTEIDRYTPAEKEMMCNCVREKETIKFFAVALSNQQFANYKCSKNGNYLPIQCISSNCYCVDEYGYQKGGPKPIMEMEELKDCYKDEYKDQLGIL